MAKLAELIAKTKPPLTFSRNRHFGEQAHRQRRLLTRFNQRETGWQANLGGKATKQRLAEAMDRLDPQTAAARIKDTRKQCPRTRDHIRVKALTKGLEVAGNLRARRHHPARKAAIDPVCHLSRPGFGEGQAEDGLRLEIVRAQQQSQHARRKHLRLPRSCRSRKPDKFLRISRAALLLGKRFEGVITTHDHAILHTASDGHNRYRARIRGALWQ